MAIGHPGMYYDANRDMHYDSKAQYDRHMEHLRYEQQRMMQAQQQRMMQAQQQMAYNPYGGAIAGGHHAEQQRQVPVVDPNDPLAFLKKADNKLLLTGEPS